MKEINALQNYSTPLKISHVGKGCGLPMMNSKAWDAMFPSDTLKGISRSPMSVSNGVIFNNVIYGN